MTRMATYYRQLLIILVPCVFTALVSIWIYSQFTTDIINDDQTMIHVQISKLEIERDRVQKILCAYEDSIAKSESRINTLQSTIAQINSNYQKLRDERKNIPTDTLYLDLIDSIWAYRFRPRFEYVLPNRN